jgi:hypothetical protein
MTVTQRIAAAAALALGTVLGAAGPFATTASAATTAVNLAGDANKGASKLGSYRGSATYDDQSKTLTVVLENTSAGKKGGGYLTGFAFNLKGNAKAKYLDGDVRATKKKDEDAFDDAGKKKGTKVKKFGKFLAGVGLDGKLGAKSKAARGVGAGASRTFVFKIDGATGLTANDLLAGDNAFVAFFGGFSGKKTDTVPGALFTPAPAPTLDNSSPTDPGPSEGTAQNTDPTPTGGTTNGTPPGFGGATPGGSTTDTTTTTTTTTNNDGIGGGNTTTTVIIPPPVTPPVFPAPADLPDPDETTEVVVGGGGDVGAGAPGGGTVTAIPLPPAAWTGLATLGVLGLAGLRRKFRTLVSA